MNNQPPVISRFELTQPAGLARLDLACREWGCFYLTDHGIDQAEPLFDQAHSFFAEPRSKKSEVRRTSSNAWGFFDEELTKNTRDWKEVFDFGPKRGDFVPQFPNWHPGLKAACEAHYAACEALSFELLSAMSSNLGVGDTFLFHAFEPEHASFVRLNYYPRCPQPAAPAEAHVPQRGHLGVNHHTDAGALTLLMTDDVPGLEVYVHDRWHGVPPLTGAMIVNLGDIIQVWSNDRYKSPLHRVRCQSKRARMSIPFFFNPRESFDYAPLTSTTSDATPSRYRPINFGEFRNLRAAGDYADQGEEVQIDQFRIDTSEV
jgi:isopenicillin N synthase-like dioxygenase